MTTLRLRCVGKRCLDGPPLNDQPAPRWAAEGLLCRRCHHHLERQLAELPATLDAVRGYLGGLTTPGRNERPSTGSMPAPLNVDAHDALQAANVYLTAWTQNVAEDRSLRGPDDPRKASGWLLAQLDWITQQPYVDDLADELYDVLRLCEGVVHARPLRHRLEAPCPSCSAYELGRWDGKDHVDCAGCGRTWDEKHYPSLALVTAQVSGGCMTAVEVTAHLGITVAALRVRVHRKQIRKLGTVDGLAYYSADDVRALTDSQERDTA